MSAHTKGPWRATKDSQGLWDVRNDERYVIGSEGIFYGTVAEDEADAHLIAAAPELLRACEAMSAHYSGSLDHQPPYVALARAAIAKATGRAQ